MTNIAFITRDKKTKEATLHLEKDIAWKIYAGKNMESIDYSTPLLSGQNAGTYPLPINRTAYACFSLQTPDKTRILAEKHLPITGGYNIRDLGGYIGAAGKRIVWGKFFRADDLAHLSDEDLAYLSSIPLVTVFDFRTQREVDDAPDKLPSTIRNIIHRPLSPGNVSPAEIQHGQFSAYDDTDEFMHIVYRELVSNENINAVYREFFKYLKNENDLPLLFHCTAGKDRTGIATAFLLFALGVKKETIIQDYMDSNHYLAGKYTKLTQDNPQLAVLFSVKPEFLLTGIKTMEETHGTVENYLSQVLNVNIDLLRSKYLY